MSSILACSSLFFLATTACRSVRGWDITRGESTYQEEKPHKWDSLKPETDCINIQTLQQQCDLFKVKRAILCGKMDEYLFINRVKALTNLHSLCYFLLEFGFLFLCGGCRIKLSLYFGKFDLKFSQALFDQFCVAVKCRGQLWCG